MTKFHSKINSFHNISLFHCTETMLCDTVDTRFLNINSDINLVLNVKYEFEATFV